MAEMQEIVPLTTAEEQELLPLPSSVTARHCAGCTCSGVATTSSSTVGTSLPTSAGPEHSESSNDAGVGNGHVVDLSKVWSDDDEGLCAAELEATNLHELNSGKYEKLRIAFQDWQKKVEHYINNALPFFEAKQNSIRNEIYQVIGFYIVFQGVLFTAVAQSSMLRCHNWWTAFLLSLWTSLVTTVVVIQKLTLLWNLEITIAHSRQTCKVLKQRINDVKLHVGPQHFNFRINARDRAVGDMTRPSLTARLYTIGVVIVLLCFSSIFLVSCWLLLCKPGDTSP